MSKELPDLMILRICLQQPNYARKPDAAGKKMMWPGSNPDNEIDPQFNTIDEPCVSIDISNLCLSNAPDDFILFSRLQCFISITDEV